MMDFKNWCKHVLGKEGLTDWKVKYNTGGGLCLRNHKEIWMDKLESKNYALFLHEIAHAILTPEIDEKMKDKTGHHSIFADKFTSLARKYMVPKIAAQ